MSIPQPQIIYTGMNVAVPDWKTFNRDLNARMDMIRREKQQERQFEIQRQDQLNREFLRTVDIDRLNYANSSLQQTAANIYQAFDDTVSSVVQDKKGQMSVQDTLKVKALASRAEQELIKYKNWDNNYKQDLAVITNKDPNISGKWSDESKLSVVNWDGRTPYAESKLRMREWSPQEFSETLRSEYKDSNKRSVSMFASGLGDVTGKNDRELTKSFVEKLYDVSYDDKGYATLTLKKDKAIQDLKGYAMRNDYRQGYVGMMNAFDKESEDTKKTYMQLAEQETGKKDDAVFSWFIDNYMQDQYPSSVSDKPISKDTTSTKPFSINFGGKKITKNLTTPTETEYGGQAMDNFYSAGDLKIGLSKAQPIKGAKEVVDGELVDVNKTKFDDAVVVGVNVDDQGYATDVVYSVPSEKFAKTDTGEDIYQIGSGGKAIRGTLDELSMQLYQKPYSKLDSENKGYFDGVITKAKSTGEWSIIVAPAYGNESTFQSTFAVDGKVAKTRKPKEEKKKEGDSIFEQ